MKKFNTNSGFTLIEIIVVLIIVGILAAIALPNLFSNIAKSKGAEAVASFGAMKASIEGCGQKNQSYSTCVMDSSQVGLHGNFNYGFGGDCSSAAPGNNADTDTDSYCIYADGSTLVGDTAGTDYVTYTVTALGASGVCTGYGKFAGVC